MKNNSAIGWAPANPWFEAGFSEKKGVEIRRSKVHILPLPYILATNFAAFNSRGNNNPVTSNDFEDIVFILDNCLDIRDQQ